MTAEMEEPIKYYMLHSMIIQMPGKLALLTIFAIVPIFLLFLIIISIIFIKVTLLKAQRVVNQADDTMDKKKKIGYEELKNALQEKITKRQTINLT